MGWLWTGQLFVNGVCFVDGVLVGLVVVNGAVGIMAEGSVTTLAYPMYIVDVGNSQKSLTHVQN